jgi:hypothetical protein
LRVGLTPSRHWTVIASIKVLLSVINIFVS